MLFIGRITYALFIGLLWVSIGVEMSTHYLFQLLSTSNIHMGNIGGLDINCLICVLLWYWVSWSCIQHFLSNCFSSFSNAQILGRFRRFNHYGNCLVPPSTTFRRLNAPIFLLKLWSHKLNWCIIFGWTWFIL